MEASELYRKYRPQTFEEVVGQTHTVTVLKEKLAKNTLPHVILFSGSSGVGKTTLAKILSREVGCTNILDYREHNCADDRGIEASRRFADFLRVRPTSGKSKVFLLDEFHQLTSTAQQSLLTTFEDVPDYAYFFLCSSEPEKIIKAIKTRCVKFQLEPLNNITLEGLLKSTLKKEAKKVSDSVIISIVDIAQGSAREALQQLDRVMGLDSEEEQLESLQPFKSQQTVSTLARLMTNMKTGWKEVAEAINRLKEAGKDNPEGIRCGLLCYCASILLKAGANCPKYNVIMGYLEDPFYDNGQVAWARLVHRLFSALQDLKRVER